MTGLKPIKDSPVPSPLRVRTGGSPPSFRISARNALQHGHWQCFVFGGK
jgi:hypothetical protein